MCFIIKLVINLHFYLIKNFVKYIFIKFYYYLVPHKYSGAVNLILKLLFKLLFGH